MDNEPVLLRLLVAPESGASYEVRPGRIFKIENPLNFYISVEIRKVENEKQG